MLSNNLFTYYMNINNNKDKKICQFLLQSSIAEKLCKRLAKSKNYTIHKLESKRTIDKKQYK